MLRLKAGILGAACVVCGATMFFLEAKHGLTGVPAAAVLVERVEECQAEFQRVGESRRKEAMPCQSARAFRAAVGANKVRVYETTFAFLSLPMTDGSQKTVKVDQVTLKAHMTPLGGSVPVVYDPSNPDDVRLPMTFARAQFHFEVMGLGLLLLGFAFIGQILRAVLGPSSGKVGSSADQIASEPARGQLASLNARDAQRELASARMAAAGGMRHQFGTRS